MIYLFMLGILGILVALIMFVVKTIKKQSKKLPLQILVASLVIAVVGFTFYEPDNEEIAEETTVKEETKELVEEQGENEEVVLEDEPIEEEFEEEEVTWDDLKENIIGESDKDYKEVTDREPREVRNDTTGKWKITTLAENIDILDYAHSYRKLYMKDGDIHYIINFNYSTTTKFNYIGSLLYVDITEYEDKEEHDASTLGSGMLLKQYIIYPDGDIEEVY